MHTQRERVWACPPGRRSTVKRGLSHLPRTVLLSLCLPLANYLVSLSIRLSPTQMCATFFPRGIPSQRPMRSHISIIYHGSRVPSFLNPKEPCPKDGKYTTSWSLLKQGLGPLCSCHDYYFKVSSGDKAWLFTLCFSCYFPVEEQTGGWL